LLFFVCFVFIWSDPGYAAWVKQGKFEGYITDLHINSARYYAATAGAGVFRSSDGINWLNISEGLNSLDVVAVTTNPSDVTQAYCATRTTLYYSDNSEYDFAYYLGTFDIESNKVINVKSIGLVDYEKMLCN